jgi:hypothetical protein
MQLRARRVFLLISLVAPVAACASFKPLRAVAPELMGLTCSSQGVCVDDPRLMQQATALKQDAVVFVEQRLATFAAVPRILYCSTAECAKSFGFTSQAAYTVGSMGIVIGPRGWHPYLVRHELIHHLQVERWGSIRTWLFKPDWLVEGMAYSLSEDPRRPLPEPLKGWRQRFETWQTEVAESMWAAADTQ